MKRSQTKFGASQSSSAFQAALESEAASAIWSMTKKVFIYWADKRTFFHSYKRLGKKQMYCLSGTEERGNKLSSYPVLQKMDKLVR